MDASERLRAELGEALTDGSSGLSPADRLCLACVEYLKVDGAAISMTQDGSSRGTFGSSGPLSRRLDEFQFTFGEGPCLESVRRGHPVLVADLQDPDEHRWPAYAGAVLEAGVRAVYALPVLAATTYVGALDLFRHDPGPLTGADLVGGLWASELAALPLLDMMSSDLDGTADLHSPVGWEQLASLQRVEVYQATGMIMGQLGVSSVEALVRIRAHAFAHGQTASEVAGAIVDRRLTLEAHDGAGSAE